MRYEIIALDAGIQDTVAFIMHAHIIVFIASNSYKTL
jgi:hypothetical protein